MNRPRIIVGIDQSYKNTGISAAKDGKLLWIKNVQLDKLPTNSMRRAKLSKVLERTISAAAHLYGAANVVCIVERIRLHSGVQRSFISIDYIKSMGALIGSIVDVCAKYNVVVYSVDTRCWKSQVIGTSKPEDNQYGVPPEKWPTVAWCIDQGFQSSLLRRVQGRKVKGTFVCCGERWRYDDDAADSAGIAMFGVVGDWNKLKVER